MRARILSSSLGIWLALLAAMPLSSACSGSGPSLEPSTSSSGPQLPLRQLSPYDGQLRWVGRVDRRDEKGPRFAYPATQLVLEAEAQHLELRLLDTSGPAPERRQFLELEVDGQLNGPFALRPGENRLELWSSNQPEHHQFRLWKRTEGGHEGSGYLQLLSVSTDGKLLTPELKSRRILVLGDSISCGYGIELSTQDPSPYPYNPAHQNAHATYAAQLAQLLGAELVVLAVSGRGIARNYAGSPGALIGDFFPRLLPEDATSSLEASSEFGSPEEPLSPDLILIHAGTNDYSTVGVKDEDFVTRYLALLEELKRRYPAAKLALLLGPMLSDGGPEAPEGLSRARRSLQQIAAQGPGKELKLIEFPPQSPPFGEHWHPALHTHHQMAQQLAPELAAWMKW